MTTTTTTTATTTTATTTTATTTTGTAMTTTTMTTTTAAAIEACHDECLEKGGEVKTINCSFPFCESKAFHFHACAELIDLMEKPRFGFCFTL